MAGHHPDSDVLVLKSASDKNGMCTIRKAKHFKTNQTLPASSGVLLPKPL